MMEKTKFLTIAVIALLVLNGALIVFLWMGHRRLNPPPPKNGRPPAAAFLIKNLDFDENQTTLYDGLRKAHRAAKDSLQNTLRRSREIYFKGIPTDDTSKLAEIGEIQKESDRITFVHFQKVRALCRPDQQTKFDEVIGEVLKMMANNTKMPPKQGEGPHRD